MQEKEQGRHRASSRKSSKSASGISSPATWCVCSIRAPRCLALWPSAATAPDPTSMAAEAGEADQGASVKSPGNRVDANPASLPRAQSATLQANYAELRGALGAPAISAKRTCQPVIEPEPGDNRFKDPDWIEHPVLRLLEAGLSLDGALGRGSHSQDRRASTTRRKKRALFYLEQMLSAPARRRTSR